MAAFIDYTLELQRFLVAHPDDWESLLTQKPYCLKIKHNDKLVLFKYDQVESDFHEPIVRECRGIILEEGTWTVVRCAFFKFFNLGEELADNIDWNWAKGTEKIDGSLMSVWWYDGQWRLSTNGMINAFDAFVSVFDTEGNLTNEKISFGEIFTSVLPLEAFSEFDLDKDICYTFELVSPKTQVIIKYDEPAVYLTAARYMSTLVEVPMTSLSRLLPEEMVNKYGIKFPKMYHLNSMADYQELIKEMDGDDHEGIVVREGEKRVKMKTVEYLTRHYYKGAGINLDRLANVVVANEESEFLSYFPEHETGILKIHAYIDAMKEFAATCDGNLAVFDVDLHGMQSILDPRERRKFFAKWVTAHFGNDPYKKGMLFKGYDGKAVQTVEEWTPGKWIDFLKYAVEHPEEWRPKYDK